jgi:hypothetical protein
MTGLRAFRGAAAIATAIAGLLFAAASSAQGPTFVGETFDPQINCTVPRTLLQETSVNDQYVVPFSGVITGWNFLPAADAPTTNVKLVVGRGGAGTYTIVDEDVPAPGNLGTTNAQVPVQQGDIIGLGMLAEGPCFRAPAPGYTMAVASSDVTPGTTAQFTADPSSQLDVSATLEHDADNDGCGDESFDPNPSQPSPNCAGGGANVKITKHPPKKDDDNTVKFTFGVGPAAATFECRVNGGALVHPDLGTLVASAKADSFEPCTSPQKVKVKDGKHTFKVRAVVNGVPGPVDSFKWKVVPNDGGGHG